MAALSLIKACKSVNLIPKNCLSKYFNSPAAIFLVAKRRAFV